MYKYTINIVSTVMNYCIITSHNILHICYYCYTHRRDRVGSYVKDTTKGL